MRSAGGRAPRGPPSRSPSAAAAAAISGRSGLPVTVARGRSVPANDTALAVANRRSTRLTAPARTFCSTTTSGRAGQHRADPAGEAARTRRARPRPPGGGAARARCRATVARDEAERGARRWPRRQPALDAPAGQLVEPKPAAGTSSASTPRSLPTKWMLDRLVAPRDQRLGDGEPGQQVPGGAAAGDEAPQVTSASARARVLGWRATLRRKPGGAMVTSSDEPPKETNGSGTPVIGSRPITSADVDERLHQEPGRDAHAGQHAEAVGRAERGADAERRRGRRTAPTTSSAPTRPSSSPMMAKMKSVWANGQEAPLGPRLAEARRRTARRSRARRATGWSGSRCCPGRPTGRGRRRSGPAGTAW